MASKLTQSIETLLVSADETQPVWLQVGALLDGLSSKPIRDAHVVYDASGIRYVGDADAPPPAEVLSAGSTEPDCILPDTTLLPGLIEAHAHLFLDGAPVDLAIRKDYLQQSPSWMLERSRDRLQKLMLTGVLGVRDAGDNRGVGLQLSKEYNDRVPGDATSPYIDSPGPSIHHKGRYGSFMSEPVENEGSPAACVEGRVRSGADRIKLIATGIINFKAGAVTAPPQMDCDELKQYVEAAKRFDKPTFAHASGAGGLENVIEACIDSVEHAYFVTENQLQRMADRQIAWVATFAPVQVQIDEAKAMGWDDTIVSNLQKIVDDHMASFAKAVELGVPIVAGSDAGSCGVAHGLGLLYELELMQQAGMSAIQVINRATGYSAQHIGYKEPIGKITQGYRSRMLLTRHDPLETVSNLRKAMTILFDGQVLTRQGNHEQDGL